MGSRARPVLWSPFGRSGAERGPGGKFERGRKLRGRDFLSILRLRFEHFDPPALRSYEEARRGDLGDFAHFAFHRPERAERMLAGVEDLDPLAVDRGPRARSR